MRMRILIIAVVAAVAVQTAGAQDSDNVLHAAADALGMLRGVLEEDSLSTIQYEGSGFVYAFDQALRPGMPPTAFKLTRYKAGINYDVPGMRVDFDRTNPDGVVRQIQVVAEKFAWNEAQPGMNATPAQGTFNDRLLQLWMTPPGVIKAARQAGANVKVTVERGATVITTPVPGLIGKTMKATLNTENLIERVEAPTYNPVLGDTLIETTYSDYKDLGGELYPSDVLFPTRIVQKMGGHPVLDLTITKGNTYNPYVVFPLPENVK